MEDNEFEDVLVISYTDRGSSILPQSTAERIMKNIRLEVTQKLKPDSNPTSASSKTPKSQEPTLLEHLCTKIISPHIGPDFAFLRVFHYLPGSLQSEPRASDGLHPKQPADKCLLATNNKVCIVTAAGELLASHPAANANFVAWWHGLLLVFPYNAPAVVWDADEQVFSSASRYVGYFNAGVVLTADEIFFLDSKKKIVRVFRNDSGKFEEETLGPNRVADISFCFKTKILEHLDHDGVMTTNRGTFDVNAAILPLVMLSPDQEFNNKLLSMTKLPGRRFVLTSKLHLSQEDPRPCVMLVGGKTLSLLSHLVFPESWIISQNYHLLGMRVLRSRGGITPLLCKQGCSLFLLGVYGDQLSLLKTCTAADTNNMVYNVTPIRGGWLVSTDRGLLLSLAVRSW